MKLLLRHIQVNILAQTYRLSFQVRANLLNSFSEKLSVIAGVLLAASIDKPVMLPRIEQAIKNVLHNPSDVFYTGKFMDLFFNGIEADCTVKETFTAALCANLEDQPFSVGRIDENHLKFSFFGYVS